MSKYQRSKGRAFEQQIARLFRKIYPHARRHLEFQKEEAELGIDVKAGPYDIQCKAYKNYAPISKIEEVKSNGIPLLITKGDRKRPVVCMYLEDFLDLDESFVNISEEMGSLL